MKITEHNETQSRDFSSIQVQLEQSKSKQVQLERVLRAVQDDSAKITEHNKAQLRDFSIIQAQLEQSKSKEVTLARALREVVADLETKQGTLSDECLRKENDELFKMIHKLSQFSNDVKMQLGNSKSKEKELAQALREVVSNVKRDQGTMSEELAIVYKLTKSEVALVEEMLRNASEEIAEKTGNIRSLKNDVELLQSSLKEDKEQTKKEITNKNDIINDLESDMEQLKKTFEEEKAQNKMEIVEKSNIICTLESDMERTQQSLEEDKEKTKLILCEKIERLEMDVKSSESRLLEKEITLNKELEESQASYSKLQFKADEISEKLINADSLNHDLKDQIDSMKHSLHKAREESQTFAEKLGHAIRENHDLNKLLISATEEHCRMNEKASRLESENTVLKRTVGKEKELNVRIEQLRLDDTEENRQVTEKLTSLKSENAALKKSSNEKDEANGKLERVLEETTRSMDVELDNLKAILESKTDKFEGEREEMIDMLEKKAAAIAHEKQTQAVQIESLMSALSESESEALESEAALTSARASNEDLNTKLANATKEMNSLKRNKEKQLADMAEATEMMHKEIHELQSDIEKMGMNKASLEAALKSATSSNAELNTKLVDTTKEMNTLKKDKETQVTADTVEATEIMHKKKIHELQSGIDKMSKNKASLEAALRSAESSNEELNTKLVDTAKEMNTLKRNREKQAADMGEATEIMHKKIHKLQSEIDEMSKNKASLEVSAEATQEVNAEIKIKLMDEITALKEKLQDTKACKDKQLIDIEKSNEIMHKQLHDLKSNIDESQIKASITNQEVSSLQSDLTRVNEYLGASKERNTEIQKEMEELGFHAQDMESTLNNTIKALKLELTMAKRHLEKSNAKLKKSNTQLKSALQSLDEMMKYIKNMQGENDEAVALLENDLGRAIKMKHDAESGMKKRIHALQASEKKQQESLNLQDEERRKLMKELERVRIDTIKEVSKARKAHERDLDRKNTELKNLSSQVEALTFELKTLQNQSNTDVSKYEASLQERSLKVQSLMLELQEYKDQSISNGEIKEELEASLQDCSSQIHSLRIELRQIRKQSIDDGEIKKNLEASLKERSSQVDSLMREFNRVKQELETSLQVKSVECDSNAKEMKVSLQTVEKLELELHNEGKHRQKLETYLQVKSVECDSQVKELNASLQTIESLELKLKYEERLRQELEASLQVKSVDCDSKVKECKESLLARRNTIEKLTAQLDALRQNCNEEVDQWSKKFKECKDELTESSHKLEISVSRQSLLVDEKEQLVEKLQAEERENAALQQERSECADLTTRLDKKTKGERALRREVVQKKQLIATLQSNEKHLEEHVVSLEEQIDKLVLEYESKLQVDHQPACG